MAIPASSMFFVWNWFTMPIIYILTYLRGWNEFMSINNYYIGDDEVLLNTSFDCSGDRATYRTLSGECNDPDFPLTGSVGTSFNRAIYPKWAQPEDDFDLLRPNPRYTARYLLWDNRGNRQKVDELNLLTVAFLQFVTNDLVYHGQPNTNSTIDIAILKDDPLWNDDLSVLENVYSVPRTLAGEFDGTFDNHVSAFMDASMVYGTDTRTNTAIRDADDSEKLAVLCSDNDCLLPRLTASQPIEPGVNQTTASPTGLSELSGFTKNWWLGLSLVTNLFVLEHNSVVDELRKFDNNTGDEDFYYNTARLIVSALITKIHTQELIPALLGSDFQNLESSYWLYGAAEYQFTTANHPGRAVDPNDYDTFAEWYASTSSAPIFGGTQTMSGSNGSTPFQATEALVSVMRMHAMLPETMSLSCAKLDKKRYPNVTRTKKCKGKSKSLEKLMSQENVIDLRDEYETFDLLYSFGKTSPYNMYLNSYPKTLTSFLDDNTLLDEMDLATIDLIRNRERGVPRYNQFRRSVGLMEMTHFENITESEDTIERLEFIYGDIDEMDLLVGMMAENEGKLRVPDGFLVGETQYSLLFFSSQEIIRADRFYTDSFDVDIYTDLGMTWLATNSMYDVITRHYPSLEDYIPKNAFSFWDKNWQKKEDATCNDKNSDFDDTIIGLSVGVAAMGLLLLCLGGMMIKDRV